MKDEIITLFDGLKIIVNDRCKFTTDSVVLSRFTNPSPKERVCDFCAGSAIVPLLWFGKGEKSPKSVTCVEIEPEIAQLAESTVNLNALSEKMSVICGDLKNLDFPKDGMEYDVVTCNPPYYKENTGKTGSCQNARQEIFCTTEDVCAAASKQLKYGGRLCLCQRPDRLVDVVCAMRNHNIEPKKIRLVAHSVGKEPFLVLVEGKKGAKPLIKFMPTLYLEENNAPSKEQLEIYRN